MAAPLSPGATYFDGGLASSYPAPTYLGSSGGTVVGTSGTTTVGYTTGQAYTTGQTYTTGQAYTTGYSTAYQPVEVQAVQAVAVQPVQQVQQVQQVAVQQVQAVPVQAVQQVQQVQVVEAVPMQQVMIQQPMYTEVVSSPSPVKVKKEEPVKAAKPVEEVAVRAAAPPPPPPEPEYIFRDKEIVVDKVKTYPVEKEIVNYIQVTQDISVVKEVAKEVVRVVNKEVPFEVEKIVYKEIPVPVEVPVDKIIEKIVIQEVPVDKVVTKEVAVPVEKVVVKEVPVTVDKVVERIVHKEVPVEKIITREVPVEVEKIVYREVQVPVEKIVDKYVEVPVEKVVYQDRIVYQDKVVYQDKTVEVPVERHVASNELQYGTTMTAGYQSGLMYGSVRETGMAMAGRRVGLGLVLRRADDGNTFIKEIIHGFAAQRQGGVQAEDQLLAVDNKPVIGWELDDIKHLTVGEEGSMCTLTLQRDGKSFQVNLQRVPGEQMVSEAYRGMALESAAMRPLAVH